MTTLVAGLSRNVNLGWVLPLVRARWPLAAVFLVSMLFYLLTMAPTIYSGIDFIEYTTVAYTLGIPHATGYPLYLLIAKAFTYLPVGDVGYRVNLMSAVFAAAASVVVFKLVLSLTGRHWPAIAAALFFSFSYYVWSLAVIAEVYTLHAFLTGLIILLWFRWEATCDRRFLFIAAMVWGLGVGNHLTIGLMAPAFGYLVIRALLSRNLRVRDVLLMAGVFLVGAALVYAYLPWRYAAGATPNVVGHYGPDGAFLPVDITSADGMWWMLTGQQYGHLFFFYSAGGFLHELADYFRLLHGNFLAIGLVIGAIGMVRSACATPHQFALLFLVFALNVLFIADYGAIDKETMYLPTYVVWAVWVGVGIVYLAETFASYPRMSGPPLARAAGRLIGRAPWQHVALLLPVAAIVVNFSYADVSFDSSARDEYSEFMRIVEPDALVLAGYIDAWPLIYLQKVEGMRDDVTVIDRFKIPPQNEVKLVWDSLATRPVYVFGILPPLPLSHGAERVWKGSSVAQKIVNTSTREGG